MKKKSAHRPINPLKRVAIVSCDRNRTRSEIPMESLHSIDHIESEGDHPDVTEGIEIGTRAYCLSSCRAGSIFDGTVDEQSPDTVDDRKYCGVRLVECDEFVDESGVAVVIASAVGVLHAQALDWDGLDCIQGVVVILVEGIVVVAVNSVKPETREDQSDCSDREEEWSQS